MQIIYADQEILVINKPSGVLSIVDGYHKDLPYLRTILEPDFGRLWIVHRLDKETSGVMLLARSPEAHKKLNQQFTQHSIKKQYISLVFGHCPAQFTDDSPLLVNGDRRHRTIVEPATGKSASTEFTIQEYFPVGCSLVSAFPKTGFSHQIRAHLLHLGFPILGDQLYTTRESLELTLNLQIQRVMLHARQIEFIHPESGLPVSFCAENSPDFAAAINICKKTSIN
jgi:RluA family pseudouridine synthase